MAFSKSKIGIYSVAGILTAVLIVVSFVAAGIQFPTGNNFGQPGNDQNQLGTLVVALKDAPADMEKLMLTVGAIYIQDPTQEEDTWTQLPFKNDAEDNPQTEIKFDLLQYEDISLQVAEIKLNKGQYHKVRLEILSAVAIMKDNDADPENNPQVPLKVPPGHIDIIVDVEIQAGKVTELTIDIDPSNVKVNKNDIFRPVIKATAKVIVAEPEVDQNAVNTNEQEPSVPPSQTTTEPPA
jgi:hypothetical protein